MSSDLDIRDLARSRRVEQEVLDLLDEPTIRHTKADKLRALLDKIATELRNARAVSDEAVSREGIYADHP